MHTGSLSTGGQPLMAGDEFLPVAPPTNESVVTILDVDVAPRQMDGR